MKAAGFFDRGVPTPPKPTARAQPRNSAPFFRPAGGGRVEAPSDLEGEWVSVGGTGSASTLPMSDEEKTAAREREERKPPVGFGAVAQAGNVRG
jgi:hypothetical protein